MTSGNALSLVIDRLAQTPILLVATDFDGTISPIVPDPAAARPDPRSIEALGVLAALESTHVGVVSGRSLATLRSLLGACDHALLVGSHGAELDGEARMTQEEASSLSLLLNGVEHLAQCHPGLIIEPKPTGVAVHYRHVDESRHQDVITSIESLARCAPTAVVKPGLLVREILVTRATKGTAITALRRRTGAGAVVFIGDDVTDEDAFASLEPPDVAIKVGDAPSLASLRLPDTAAVASFLQALMHARRSWLARRSIIPINHHALLSDQRTVAIVEPRARVSWLCVPRIDSSAVFASLLGGDRAGFFDVLPEPDETHATQSYDGDSFTLRTRFGSEQTPALEVVDYLDASSGRPFQRAGRTDLIRVISGRGRAIIRFSPRLDFGRIATTLRPREGGLEVVGNADPLVLFSPGIEWEITQDGHHHGARATIDLSRGPFTLELRAGAASLKPIPAEESKRRDLTRRVWSGWADQLMLPALMPALVKRSALVIKALCYGPTGAISAAATTSLPETLGGCRNWDYRFCWVRDAAWSASSLVRLGSTGHAMKFLDWLSGIVADLEGPERLRPLYTIAGHDLGAEAEISDLSGYGDSRPVRVGNAANQQVQLDVFGTVADLIASLAESGAPLTPEHMRLLDAMVEAVARRWTEPDHGIWEIRDTPRHHVSSKVMCWNTVNRAITARQIVDGVERESDAALRTRIHEDVLAHGWSERLGGFAASYGCDEPDASTLLAPLTGFLPPNDPRITRTIEAIERTLLRRGTVYRYLMDDGLPGYEGGFNICTGWLVESLALIGRTADALALLKSLCATAGPLGLMAEEHDPMHGHHPLNTHAERTLEPTDPGRALGNFPQCYSHLALINACCRLSSLNVIGADAQIASH
ncbi:MAG: trehalose-phosphatase [Phycisphaeraceae bacterium]|nr:trehalose-phosphatase [Phycisphaeraceae bacterium]MCW5767826.1 trehalose-phosphatase [Phycisphaeraceae bacterium]